mgnify:CR=1 FL=1
MNKPYLIVDGKPFLKLDGEPPENINKILQKTLDDLINQENKNKSKEQEDK